MAKEKKEDKPANEALHAEEAKAAPTTKPPTFEGKVNKYGLLHFGANLRNAWD